MAITKTKTLVQVKVETNAANMTAAVEDPAAPFHTIHALYKVVFTDDEEGTVEETRKESNLHQGQDVSQEDQLVQDIAAVVWSS